MSNGFTAVFSEVVMNVIDSDPDMKAFLLGQVESQTADLAADVDPEVQAAVDAEYGYINADVAQTFMEPPEQESDKLHALLLSGSVYSECESAP